MQSKFPPSRKPKSPQKTNKSRPTPIRQKELLTTHTPTTPIHQDVTPIHYPTQIATQIPHSPPRNQKIPSNRAEGIPAAKASHHLAQTCQFPDL